MYAVFVAILAALPAESEARLTVELRGGSSVDVGMAGLAMFELALSEPLSLSATWGLAFGEHPENIDVANPYFELDYRIPDDTLSWILSGGLALPAASNGDSFYENEGLDLGLDAASSARVESGLYGSADLWLWLTRTWSFVARADAVLALADFFILGLETAAALALQSETEHPAEVYGQAGLKAAYRGDVFRAGTRILAIHALTLEDERWTKTRIAIDPFVSIDLDSSVLTLNGTIGFPVDANPVRRLTTYAFGAAISWPLW